MRSRITLFTLCFYLAIAVLGCSSKPPADNSGNTATAPDSAGNAGSGAKDSKKEAREEKKKAPVIVPAGTTLTVRLGSDLGSKLSQAGQTFNGTLAKDIMVGDEVVIPKGSTVTGTVTDAKALGKFKGGALLNLRLDSINLNGYDMQIQTAMKTFTEKGKGKRTAVATGGGAALGGIIGAIAGGGKGAAIGLAAGAGAGAGGSALTGNKEIILPAESAVSFELTNELKLERM